MPFQMTKKIKNNIVGSHEVIKGQRDYLFDNMKAVLIFLVVVGHVMNPDVFTFLTNQSVYVFIFYFHMPAFIFISGYFSKNVDRSRDVAFSNFFVPYILLTLASYFYMGILNQGNFPQFRIFGNFLGCWYFFVIFVYKLLIKDMAKIRFAIPFFLLLGILSGFSKEFSSKMSLARLFSFAFFFILGYYTEEKHINWIRKLPKTIFITISIAIYIACRYLVKYKIVSMTALLCKTYYSDKHLLRDVFVRISFYCFAILLTMALINLISSKKNFITLIGQNTITVYILHLFVARYIDFVLEEKGMFVDIGKMTYAVAVLIISIIITYLFSRPIVVRIYNGFMNIIYKVFLKNQR